MARFITLILFLICISSTSGCKSPTDGFDPSAQTSKLHVILEGGPERVLSFTEFSALENLPEVEHQDHLFGEKRRYIGLNLSQLKQLGGADESYKVLKLHCRDGYVSEIETSVLEEGEFLLAFRDLGASPEAFVDYSDMVFLQTQSKKLEEQLQSEDLTDQEALVLSKERDHIKTLNKDMKGLNNQGPFYPVFQPKKDSARGNRWTPPFCVDKITFAKHKTDKTSALPTGLTPDHPAMRGSKLFQQRCATCHGINGIGGQVGPELNRPLSVTEYWQESAIRQMMKDPSKVRGNSKMPSLHLKDDMIDDILAYLQWMAQNKKL